MIFKCPLLRLCAPGVVALVLFVAHSSQAVAQKRYQDLTYPPLGEIQTPEPTRVTLPNGMRLFLLEDHELPFIDINAMIRVGSIYEPADKIGLADMVGEVMRLGGAGGLSADEINNTLESMAASVETGIAALSGSASLSVLRDDIDAGLDILAKVLRQPDFAPDQIELARTARLTGILHRNDEIGDIGFREFSKLLYGADSVYARHEELATIQAITRADMVAFHARFFKPNQILMGIVGDFETDAMVEKIKKNFADWPAGTEAVPEPPAVSQSVQPSIHLAQKDDVNQSIVMIGHLGGRQSDPDYFDMIIMNKILGGGMTSRIFSTIRTKMGLAYSVRSIYSGGYVQPGVFYAYAQTGSGSTIQCLEALEAEMRRMVAEEVTDEELTQAKENYLNSFVFNFDSKSEIVNRLLVYEYFGLPADYLQQAQKRIRELTPKDIARAARKHIKPDAMRILIVGKPDDFDRPLTEKGEVKAIDISIPGGE